MPKNIVIFSDGTGQEGGKGNPTNIYKIFRMLENRSPDQISFYDRGLGTGWRKFGGNVFGTGISKNIRECYQFIFNNFESGDQIFLFGFSRGAATVRSLSGFIHMFGMLPKSRPDLIEKAWKIYKENDEINRKNKASILLSQHHNMWVRIKFLGVFDTVAALGVPNKFMSRVIDHAPWMKHRFHDFKLSKSVENAYQALAIDDERETFHPIIWNPELKDHQKMEQVWFAGVHTDVGGGYAEQKLSDISLEWMLGKARPNGLRIYTKNNVKIDPDANGTMHDPFDGAMPWRRLKRLWDSEKYGKPKVHNSVFNRSLDNQNKPNSNYDSWIVQIPHDVV
jgi:uncharacterized protein (DUF2235 family)